MIRPVIRKEQSDISKEWDALAIMRRDQIIGGKDTSYTHFIVPNMISLLETVQAESILDAGCGVGILTAKLSEKAASVVGIDPSAKSIEIARNDESCRAKFSIFTLEEFALHSDRRFDAVVANMVLMDVLNLNAFLQAAHSVLNVGGRILFSMTHPCFWPEYRGYSNKHWFQYEKEILIEAPFVITEVQTNELSSTHFHRPLGVYLQTLIDVGFSIEKIIEPMPDLFVEKLYPEPWKKPRYIFGTAVKALPSADRQGE
jgi:2-polyprenyl-3-methyl-5-hydroxy-6-metoxy-1,4-benzoquinol methylase